MARDLLSLLTYEAKRRPALAELIANVDRMSEAEINAVAVPLPWMRRALLLIKATQAMQSLAAYLEQCIVDGQVVDPPGEMRRWQGDTSYIKIGRSDLEIQHGQLIWIGANELWIDTIRAKLVDPALLRQTVSCGPSTRSAYMIAVRERRQNLAPCAPLPSSEPVRFYRPT